MLSLILLLGAGRSRVTIQLFGLVPPESFLRILSFAKQRDADTQRRRILPVHRPRIPSFASSARSKIETEVIIKSRIDRPIVPNPAPATAEYVCRPHLENSNSRPQYFIGYKKIKNNLVYWCSKKSANHIMVSDLFE